MLFSLHREKERLKMILEGLPETISLDADYDLARRLSIVGNSSSGSRGTKYAYDAQHFRPEPRN